MLQKRPQSLSPLSCSRVERAHNICIFIVNNEKVSNYTREVVMVRVEASKMRQPKEPASEEGRAPGGSTCSNCSCTEDKGNCKNLICNKVDPTCLDLCSKQ